MEWKPRLVVPLIGEKEEETACMEAVQGNKNIHVMEWRQLIEGETTDTSLEERIAQSKEQWNADSEFL